MHNMKCEKVMFYNNTKNNQKEDLNFSKKYKNFFFWLKHYLFFQTDSKIYKKFVKSSYSFKRTRKIVCFFEKV